MYPHPDEKQRMQLSRDLGLEPRQVKFWFQNRRTQMKAQHERSDNCVLRQENDRIRCENISMIEALKNIVCPSCGSSQVSEDSYFDEQKLRMENARLKEETRLQAQAAGAHYHQPQQDFGRRFASLSPNTDSSAFPKGRLLVGKKGNKCNFRGASLC